MQALASSLRSLPLLSCVDLSGTAVTANGLVAFLEGAAQLRALRLANCSGLIASAKPSDTAWVASIAALPRLEWLDLRGTGVTRAHIRALAPSVVAGRLGTGSVLLDEPEAEVVRAGGEAARAMRLDASDDEIRAWKGAELEVRAWGEGETTN